MTTSRRRGRILPPSTVLQNRYRILRLHDQGGSATVYLAERLGVDESVPLAVKELNPDAFSLAEFKNEVNVLYSLNHPNLPKVYDFFEQDGKHYLVMDFVRGKTLKQVVLERGALGEDEALDYALQICDIMTYLHRRAERRIIHRDLKPSNLMLTHAGQVKLLDFGIARVPDSRLPGNLLHAYTEDYASPEQKENRPTDQRSDIYSFGVTLRSLLEGRLPGVDEEAPAEDLSPPRRRPRVSREIRRILGRCLRPDPAERYQSFEELARDLRSYRQARRTRTARRLGFAAAALGVASLLFLAKVLFGPSLYPILGPERLQVGVGTALQVGLPAGWEGSLDGIVWDIIDTQAPGQPREVQRGRYCSFVSTDLGVFQVQAYLETNGRRRLLSTVKTIEVYPALSVPHEVLVGQRFTLSSPGATAGGGRQYTWQWTIRGPIEGADAASAPVVLQKSTTEPRLRAEMAVEGTYAVWLSVNVKAPGGLEVSTAAPAKTLAAVTRLVVDPSRVISRNPSFEEQYGGQPTDWVLVYTAQLTYDKTIGRTGSRSIRFTPKAGSPTPYAVQLLPLEDGRSYRATVWVRGENVADGGRISLEARFRSLIDETYVLSDESVTVDWSGTFEWRQVVLYFSVPSGRPANLELYLRFSGGGSVWFDDCVVEKL
ncbi:MAG: serine/threonine-protein kinase [Bacillota bacterium]